MCYLVDADAKISGLLDDSYADGEEQGAYTTPQESQQESSQEIQG